MSFFETCGLCAFHGKAQALFDISLEVGEGEIVAIIGANGAGKSTLFDGVMGLARTEGDIRLAEESIAGKGATHAVRAGIGYASERFNLFPHMSVRDNLLTGAWTARESIAGNLERVHALFPRLAERKAQEAATCSGGERQMISLGRALMSSPKLLLVDEPTIGLAPRICAEIARALQRMQAEMGLTVLIAEQNANFAIRIAERLYILESGRIRATGRSDELAKDEGLVSAYFGKGAGGFEGGGA
ncbi:MAG: ABC transporter ATP-binding protein [Ectothiorhodospiraceae bacterium AqS1]|nr:ABC transporter ATP-binding protein [Ectothiorhodospiraceae bacterium AqS1]